LPSCAEAVRRHGGGQVDDGGGGLRVTSEAQPQMAVG
jgi:hypothetical protein